MSKVDEHAASIFRCKGNAGIGNTTVSTTGMWLHGNQIARHSKKGIEICDGGFASATTRARLKAIVEKSSYSYEIRFLRDKGMVAQMPGNGKQVPFSKWISLEKLNQLLRTQ